MVNPRNSCDKITPEFPLAPLNEPEEIAFAKEDISGCAIDATSFAADIIVIDIFVPVSPSGTGKTFNSIMDAERYYGLSKSGISNCCRGESKSAGTFNDKPAVWMYYNDYLKLTNEEVNKKIERQVEEANKQAEAISEALIQSGQSVYRRDINNAMYVTDNVNHFFVGLDGQIYIVYPYGNSNFTSEMDVIKI